MLLEERALLLQGKRRIAGVDEVGVGAITGSLIAVVVILPLPQASPAHLTALTHYGPCPLHHRQNKIIRSLIQQQ